MKVRWRRRALADLARIKAYLRQRSSRAAKTVVARIRERTEGLAIFPEACPLIGAGALRKLVITGTPYVAYYDVSDGEIGTRALFHASQDRPWEEFTLKSVDRT